MFPKLWLFCGLILLSGCKETEIREFKDKFNGMPYGEIHKVGSKLLIAMSDLNISRDSSIFWICQLREFESSRGRRVEMVEVYKKFTYVDLLKDKDLILRFFFYKPDSLTDEKRISFLKVYDAAVNESQIYTLEDCKPNH
ncbi:MAG: hypothetical protein JNJ57_06510 [Saprospiraceae bacterium]|nr:hypothetical protein [Saprospiraceae bacterium]